MIKHVSAICVVLFLSGCSSDVVITPPDRGGQKPMPNINQSVTSSQQRAIMSGDHPDWSEVAIPGIQKRR